LNIDLEKERMSKSGVDALISAIPGLFDGRLNYNELSQDFVNEIRNQTFNNIESVVEPKQFYAKDVEIIIKNGKYYYLNEPLLDR
jgi:hypothetical protein